MWERETPAPISKPEVKRRPEVERVYEDDSWVIDLIDGKVRVSYFEDYHFVDDIVISKDTFKE